MGSWDLSSLSPRSCTYRLSLLVACLISQSEHYSVNHWAGPARFPLHPPDSEHRATSLHGTSILAPWPCSLPQRHLARRLQPILAALTSLGGQLVGDTMKSTYLSRRSFHFGNTPCTKFCRLAEGRSKLEEAGLVLAGPAFLLKEVLSSLSRPVPVPPLRGNSEESVRRRKHVGH